jgi:uncharacterized membrane protein
MATLADVTQPARVTDISWVDRLLAALVAVMATGTIVAVVQGRDEWHLVPAMVWVHLATIMTAMLLSPIMLLRRRGDRWHRILGLMWFAAMAISCLVSFDLQLINDGGFSPIHILSVTTLILLPRIWWNARQHQIIAHRRGIRLVIAGALLIAGFFTFGFNRILGQWLFGGPGI